MFTKSIFAFTELVSCDECSGIDKIKNYYFFGLKWFIFKCGWCGTRSYGTWRMERKK